MKKNFVFILLNIHLSFILFSQQPNVSTRIFSKPKVGCRTENHKVSDVKPSNCDIEPGCNYLYPVLVEEFDNNFDLPNKWQFRAHGTNDNNASGQDNPSTWFGDAYYHNNDEDNSSITNNNIQLNNGIMKIITKPEAVNREGKDYTSTGGAITSWSNFRTGTFEARIKLPTANKMWPALWLLNNSGTYAEIDIFEFFDNNVGANGSNSNCDTYDLHKMTLHTGSTSTPYNIDCHRGDKYPLNIDTWHTYKLVWDDYQISIFVDGTLKGFGTKYYKGTSLPFFPCQYGSHDSYFDALVNYDCNMLSNEPNNVTIGNVNINWGPRPNWWPFFLSWPPPTPNINIPTNIPNRVDESRYFPDKNSAMSLILNSNMSVTYYDDIPDQYSTAELTMEVDWIKVYQPFCCGVNKTVCNLLDLDNQTYKTDILTGQKITVGNSANTCNFQQFLPGSDYKYNADGSFYLDPNTGQQVIDYRDIPVILLATDEIEINGDASFPGNTYAEMRITSCGNNNRILSTEQSQINDFIQSQQDIADSLTYLVSDSLLNLHVKNYIDSVNSEYNTIDGCKLSITPNPAQNFTQINFANNYCFENVIAVYLIDINGREFEVEKKPIIDIEKFSKGTYLIKLLMRDGAFKIEKFIKI